MTTVVVIIHKFEKILKHDIPVSVILISIVEQLQIYLIQSLCLIANKIDVLWWLVATVVLLVVIVILAS